MAGGSNSSVSSSDSAKLRRVALNSVKSDSENALSIPMGAVSSILSPSRRSRRSGS